MDISNAQANPTTHEGYWAMGTQATNKQLATATQAKSSAMRRVFPSTAGLKKPRLSINWKGVRMKQKVPMYHHMKILEAKARTQRNPYPSPC